MTQQPFTPLVPRPDGRTYTIPAPLPVPELLARIQAHPLDKPGADWPFSERLAQENGWPHGFALRVIDEYRRFVYLACVADEEVTPSDEVDQAWHLHLAYTRDYWDEFCPNVLGRPLHHGPTEGGSAENDRYEANYARTLELYERTFRERPPSDIWPPASIRFDYAYSNVRMNKLLFAIAPKRTFKRKRSWINRVAWVMGAGLVAAFVFNIYPFSRNADATSDALVALVICMGIAFWLSMFLRPPGRRDEVITQPQHGYTVAFTVGVVAAAGIAEATVTGVEVSGDGSGEGGSGGGGSGGGGGGNGGSGCGSGCGGGGCGGGGCGG